MSKQEEITQWLMNCPQLYSLWNISAEKRDGANIIFPTGTSARREIRENEDVTGLYEADIIPLPSVYEEYQINCYKDFTNNNNEFNIMQIDEVEAVIDWINNQDEQQNFPEITGKTVIAVETFPFIPQIRGIEPDTGMVCYYITLRITYVNTAKGRNVECQL